MSVDWNGFVEGATQRDLIRALGERDLLAEALLGASLALEACLPLVEPVPDLHAKMVQIIERSRAMSADATAWRPPT